MGTWMAKCCSGPKASALTGKKEELLKGVEGENSEILVKPSIWEGSNSASGGKVSGPLIVDCSSIIDGWKLSWCCWKLSCCNCWCSLGCLKLNCWAPGWWIKGWKWLEGWKPSKWCSDGISFSLLFWILCLCCCSLFCFFCLCPFLPCCLGLFLCCGKCCFVFGFFCWNRNLCCCKLPGCCWNCCRCCCWWWFGCCWNSCWSCWNLGCSCFGRDWNWKCCQYILLLSHIRRQLQRKQIPSSTDFALATWCGRRRAGKVLLWASPASPRNPCSASTTSNTKEITTAATTITVLEITPHWPEPRYGLREPSCVLVPYTLLPTTPTPLLIVWVNRHNAKHSITIPFLKMIMNKKRTSKGYSLHQKYVIGSIGIKN